METNGLRKCDIWYYSAIEKKEILPFCKNMDRLEDIILSEISQTKTNTVWSHLYVVYRKKKKLRETE